MSRVGKQDQVFSFLVPLAFAFVFLSFLCFFYFYTDSHKQTTLLWSLFSSAQCKLAFGTRDQNVKEKEFFYRSFFHFFRFVFFCFIFPVLNEGKGSSISHQLACRRRGGGLRDLEREERGLASMPLLLRWEAGAEEVAAAPVSLAPSPLPPRSRCPHCCSLPPPT